MGEETIGVLIFKYRIQVQKQEMSSSSKNNLSTAFKNLFRKQQQSPTRPSSSIVHIFREKIPRLQNKKSEIEEINLYAQQLSKPIIEFQNLQKLSWHGIPDCIRPKIWKFLLKYCFLNDAGNILSRKRQEYRKLIRNYWKVSEFNEEQKKIYRTIEGDVKRIGAQYNDICKYQNIQTSLKRILFVWHMRHPQIGYVQGMCDITIPFEIVFLSQYLPLFSGLENYASKIDQIPEEIIEQIQADAYWCMTKMMENVLSNYAKGFGGLQEAYKKVQQSLKKVDFQLYQHFDKQNIDLFAFSFRNISTLLLRLFRPEVTYRVIDTYISLQQQFPEFMIFFLIAILEKFAKKMLRLKFDDLMSLIQNLPTKNWSLQDIQTVIAEAYVYMVQFGSDICKQEHKNQKD